MRWLYEALAGWGYKHPLHPVFTQLTIGLVVGAFIFGLICWFRARDGMVHAARNCAVLAWFFLIPTILFGILDWQYRLGGESSLIIRMKIGLATGLFLFLIIAMGIRPSGRRVPGSFVGVMFLCLVIAVLLGYLGGELVFGGKGHKSLHGAQLGRALFARNCSECHFPDRTEIKVGPGLAGLFSRERLPVSGKPVNENTVKEQLLSPYNKMPSFAQLKEEEIQAIVTYLKGL